MIGDNQMDKAKLFQTGRSQAVRLPKAYRMQGKEVTIRREGNKVILEPISTSWESLVAALDEFPEDFMREGRQQPKMQEREEF
ncbi:MAG: type II toxin-antitoxin system VapB family antitoxin [Halioglobus sp.]